MGHIVFNIQVITKDNSSVFFLLLYIFKKNCTNVSFMLCTVVCHLGCVKENIFYVNEHRILVGRKCS